MEHLKILTFYEEGEISSSSAMPSYIALGGKKELDEEGRRILELREAERGSPLSEVERDSIILDRGIEIMKQNGTLDSLVESFAEREYKRDMHQRIEDGESLGR